jgi:hypothetical protein
MTPDTLPLVGGPRNEADSESGAQDAQGETFFHAFFRQ